MQKVIGNEIISYQLINPEGVKNVIILHGWGQSASAWQTIAAKFPTDLTVYLIDLPGFGKSSLTHPAPTFSNYSQLLEQFITSLNLSSFVLIGHSFGGQLALNLSLTSLPILKLILISPALVRSHSLIKNVFLTLLSTLTFIKPLLPKNLVYRLNSRLDYGRASPKLKLLLTDSLAVDVSNKLALLTLPTYLIWGEKDQDILGNPKEIAAKIINCRLKIFYQAGHHLHQEIPEELSCYLNRIISL